MICRVFELAWRAGAVALVQKLRDKKLRARLYAAVNGLRVNPYPPGCKKMQGHPEYRIRVGDYRVIYGVDGKRLVVEIVKIGNRRDVYR
ncbi:MAG: type II toxin-antitoxin system RelE/ParE family toxin [Verrucomicrobiales bacterium]|jgi:mRNA interferase RelE/StbE|nr:type II toxin-antitoxin system RelE/ParE family toxin [Verrucomicrobiales bacterium]